MSEKISLSTMIEELQEYASIKDDMSEWAFNFVTDIYERYQAKGGNTQTFSGKQADKIAELHMKYIGGS